MFPFIATFIAGASTAALNYVDPSLGVSINENCGISDGFAACNVAVAYSGGPTITTVVTEPVESFAIQGGPTQSATVTATLGSSGDAMGRTPGLLSRAELHGYMRIQERGRTGDERRSPGSSEDVRELDTSP